MIGHEICTKNKLSHMIGSTCIARSKQNFCYAQDPVGQLELGRWLPSVAIAIAIAVTIPPPNTTVKNEYTIIMAVLYDDGIVKSGQGQKRNLEACTPYSSGGQNSGDGQNAGDVFS